MRPQAQVHASQLLDRSPDLRKIRAPILPHLSGRKAQGPPAVQLDLVSPEGVVINLFTILLQRSPKLILQRTSIEQVVDLFCVLELRYKLSQKQPSPVIASGAIAKHPVRKQSHKTLTCANGLRDCFVGKNTLLAMTEEYF
jgi:hypothetical protein